MKKVFVVIALFFVSLALFACKGSGIKPTVKLPVNEITLRVGQSYEIKPIVSQKIAEVCYEASDPSIVKIDGNVVEALKEGQTRVYVYFKDYADVEGVYLNITVEGVKYVTITGNQLMYVGETQKLSVVTNSFEEQIWSSSNESIATVKDGNVKALTPGLVKIILTCGNVAKEFEITVKAVPTLAINGLNEVEVGKTIKLNAVANFEFDAKDVKWECLNEDVATVDASGNVLGKAGGKVVIKLTIKDLSATFEVLVKVIDEVAPEFKFAEGVKQNPIINWGKDFDPLAGVLAIDDVDGDVSANITVVGEVNTKEYGFTTLTYSIVDKAGNQNTMTRTVEVVWNYDVRFIGHAGSYYGLMNSEEAIMYAITVLKYQAVEIDIKQTKDGVFVLSHDDTFGDYTIAQKTWAELKDYEVTKTRKAGYPSQNGSVTKDSYTAKLCTLERFLEICKEYNVRPVIELKSCAGITNSDQSRMNVLMDLIASKDMLDECILLGSAYNCLIWTRQNGYENVECQYLVNSCESDTVLQRCIDYNLDVSINVTGSYSNSDEWLAKYHDAGLKISTYTYTQYVDYPVVQTWINKGVDFLTCDWHLMDKLTLPESSNDPTSNVTHQVTFKDTDGTVLKVATVKEGRAAAAPKVTSKPGYKFVGWDKPITNVKESFEVTAVYELIKYSISFDANMSTVIESTFASKQAFIDEFYTDFYTWLKTNGQNVSCLTVNGDTVAIAKNGVNVSINSVQALKDVDKYDFEKSFSNLIYKPVTRAADGSCTIEKDENYFLNSDAYRIKYQDFDRYIYNACATQYTAYDRTYTPTSAGKIQIFFRFHQWMQGTSIACFETLPAKNIVKAGADLGIVLPEAITYTVEDEVTLPIPTATVAFLGWFTETDCVNQLTKIAKGTTGNMTLYAKWEYSTPVVKHSITYVLDGGTNPEGAPTEFEEGKELTLPTPVKEGYIFIGWTLEQNSTTYITKLLGDLTSDITLYAHYKLNVVEVLRVGPEETIKTLTEALIQATAYTKIYLLSGTYDGNVVIDKEGVEIIGPGADAQKPCESDAKAVINGTITIKEGINKVKINGVNFTAALSIKIVDSTDIIVTNCLFETTALKAGSSATGSGQVEITKGKDLLFKNNKFIMHTTYSYYANIYGHDVVENIEVVNNYFTNDAKTSDNTFSVWFKKGAGKVFINSNVFERFAGNYWTIWVGQASLAEGTHIQMIDNLCDGKAASTAACGFAVANATAESMKIEIIGNTFTYTKDTIIGIQGSSTSDAVSKPHVTIMYNKILDTSPRMRFCLNAENFYFGKNYCYTAYTDQGSPNIKANSAKQDDFATTMALDEEYAQTKMKNITYVLDGGINPENAPVKYQPGYALRLPVPTKEGFEFLGWEKVQGSKDYITILSADETGDITLYAAWKEIKAALTVGTGGTYATIQEAIAAAVEGDTIKVLPGTYTGDITLKKNGLTFVGPNDGKKYNDERDSEAILDLTFILEEAVTDIAIRGFKFVKNQALVFNGSNDTVEFASNFIEAQTSATIAVVYGKGTTYGVNIHDNKFVLTHTCNYFRPVFMEERAENITVVNNYFKNTCGSSVYTDCVRINKAGGIVKINGNLLDRFASNNWGFFVGYPGGYMAEALNDGTEVYICDNEFKCTTDGVGSGVSVRSLDSTNKVVIMGNSFLNVGGTIVQVYGLSASDTAVVDVKIQYNKFLNKSAKVLIGVSKDKVDVSYNYAYEALNGKATFEVAEVETNKMPTPEALDLEYAAYLQSQNPSGDDTKIYSKITYILNGGSLSASTRYLEGEEFILSKPTKEGYRFLGWSLTENGTEYITKLEKTQTGDVTVYAIWEEIIVQTYNITYVYTEGQVKESPCASKDEFKNIFWTELYAFSKSTLPLDTFKAEAIAAWRSGKEYTGVKLYKQDGQEEIDDQYFINSSANAAKWVPWMNVLDAVVKEINAQQVAWGNTYVGLIRIGDYLNDTGSYWNAARIEKVYKAMSKKVTLPTTYNSGSLLTIPELYVTDGRTFLGWFTEDGTKITSISKEMYGDLTLYARFSPMIELTGFALEETPTTLSKLDTYQLKWNFTPADATKKDLEFTSSNKEVATISETGLITCVGLGKTTITVIVKGNTALNVTFELTVAINDFIDGNYKTDTFVEPENSIELEARIVGKSTGKIVWTSKNPDIATVSETGVVTGVKVGYAEIVATDSTNPNVNLSFGVTVISLEDSAFFSLISASHNKDIYVKRNLNVAYAYLTDIYTSASDLLFNYNYSVDQTYLIPETKKVNRPGTLINNMEFITVHYTAGVPASSTGGANASYFKNVDSSVSAQYCVGNDGIFMCIPDGEVAYHAGDGTGTAFTWINTGIKATANVKPVWGAVANSASSTGYYFTLNGQASTVEVPVNGTYSDKSAAVLNDPNSKFTFYGPAWKVVDGTYYMGNTWACFTQVREGRISSRGGNLNSVGIETACNKTSDLWLTYQMTSQLIARLLDKYNLDTTRVVGHNMFSGKDCPQTLLANNGELWYPFMECVEAEYQRYTTMKDYTITCKSNNPDILADNGRILQIPRYTTTVSYTVTVTNNNTGVSKTATYSSVVHGIYTE